VRWRDLSLYQGEKLIPNIRGKEMVFGPTTTSRDAPCQICHGFQTRMAAVSRDLEGAKDRVDYMRTRMHYQLSAVSDEASCVPVAVPVITTLLIVVTAPRSSEPAAPQNQA